MKKGRFFSIFLMFVMLVTQLPTAAFAEIAEMTETVETTLERDDEGYYLIGTADELFLFGELVTEQAQKDFDTAAAASSSGTVRASDVTRTNVNAKLTADIDLNPGMGVSYDHRVGKVTISKGGKIYKMGTGLKGTTLGKFENEKGEYTYVNADSEEKSITTEYVEKELGLRKWSPLAPEVTYKDSIDGDEVVSAQSYYGYFDGNGHTVDGVYVYNPEDSGLKCVGFIGIAETSEYGDETIKNLTVGENSLIASPRENSFTGGVIGSAEFNSILNCVNKATVVSNGNYVSSWAGYGTFASVYGHTGGIAGFTRVRVSDSKNYGTIISPQTCGGIVGNLMKFSDVADCTVKYCENYGSIYADAENENSRAGGIIANSGGTGNWRNVGGGYIRNCANFGSVEAASAAGIIERMVSGVKVYYCANHGDIKGSYAAAGLVSDLSYGNDVTFSSSYNAGCVTNISVNSVTAGGAYPLVFRAQMSGSSITPHTVSLCYNDSDECSAEELAGENVTLTECESVPTATFASGEIAYKMSKKSSWYENRWKQELSSSEAEGKTPETYPNATSKDGSVVYEITSYCCHTDETNKENHKTALYSNKQDNITAGHTPDESGVCTHCKLYVMPPVITTASLRRAKAGVSYNSSIYMSRYSDGMSYELVKSETDDTEFTLPDGLNGYGSGMSFEIYGTPTTPGQYTFTLKAANAFGTTKKTFTLVVAEADDLFITVENLDTATVGCGYYQYLSLNLSGDAEWELLDGTLPEGITLDTKSGLLSGKEIPESAEGIYTFTIRASLYGKTVEKEFKLTVFPSGGCTHEYAEKHDGVIPTCDSTGTAEYWSCDACGGKWTDEEKNDRIWDFPQDIVRYSSHKDGNKDGVCDSCGKRMPVFKKVTEAKDITYGGTYIFVTAIGGKYYALAVPSSENEYGEFGYDELMPVCEIKPNTAGYFEYNALEDNGVMIMKAGFAAECRELDAGLPRYGLTTIKDNEMYSVGISDYGSVYHFQKGVEKYGVRISLDETDNVSVASVYSEYWNDEKDTSDTGVLRAFDMNFNGNNTKFMAQADESYYNGEKANYEGAEITRYDIQLYKAVDVGTVGENNSFVASDGQDEVSFVGYNDILTNIPGAAQSNVGGINEATKPSYVSETVAKAVTSESGSYTAELYAKIGVTEAQSDGSQTGFTSISYSLKPYIRVLDKDGNELSNSPIDNTDLSGKSMTVTLNVGSMEPEQIIHYKDDGTKEYFYSERSNAVRYKGKKSFTLEYGNGAGGNFVSFDLTSFSQVKVLLDAEDENVYSAEIENIYLQLPVGYTSNDVNALSENGFNRCIKIKNTGNMSLGMTEPYLSEITPQTDKIFVGCTSVPAVVAAGNTSDSYYIKLDTGLEKGTYTAVLNFADKDGKLAQTVTAKLVIVVGECGIKSVSQNGTKAKAEVGLLETGDYVIIFADYENDRLNSVDSVKKTVAEGETGLQIVDSVKDITIGTGDKVMVWRSIDSMTPLCNTFVAE